MFGMASMRNSAAVILASTLLVACGTAGRPLAESTSSRLSVPAGTGDGLWDTGGSPCAGDLFMCGQAQANVDVGLIQIRGAASRQRVTGTIVATGTDSRGGHVFARFKTWPNGLVVFTLPIGTYTFAGRPAGRGPQTSDTPAGYWCESAVHVVLTNANQRPGVEVICQSD